MILCQLFENYVLARVKLIEKARWYWMYVSLFVGCVWQMSRLMLAARLVCASKTYTGDDGVGTECVPTPCMATAQLSPTRVGHQLQWMTVK